MPSEARRALPRAVAALERAAAALVSANLEELVAVEPELADATASLTSMAGAAPGPPDRSLAEDLDRARNALARCWRLGANLDDVARLSLAIYGFSQPAYGRDSLAPAQPPTEHCVNARA